MKKQEETGLEKLFRFGESSYARLPDIDVEGLTPMDKRKLVTKLRREMRLSAQDLNFELAAQIRDKINELIT